MFDICADKDSTLIDMEPGYEI